MVFCSRTPPFCHKESPQGNHIQSTFQPTFCFCCRTVVYCLSTFPVEFHHYILTHSTNHPACIFLLPRTHMSGMHKPKFHCCNTLVSLESTALLEFHRCISFLEAGRSSQYTPVRVGILNPVCSTNQLHSSNRTRSAQKRTPHWMRTPLHSATASLTCIYHTGIAAQQGMSSPWGSSSIPPLLRRFCSRSSFSL